MQNRESHMFGPDSDGRACSYAGPDIHMGDALVRIVASHDGATGLKDYSPRPSGRLREIALLQSTNTFVTKPSAEDRSRGIAYSMLVRGVGSCKPSESPESGAYLLFA